MQIFGKGFNFSQDGPGNRLVYHLSGCNMHCPWCSNPEGMCATAGSSYSIDQVVDECVRSQMLFFDGGGVTFTGGEATLQHQELLQTLKALKAKNIHTAIETNGTSHHLAALAEYIDYLIMDFKHYDDVVLKQYTGVGCGAVKQNFEQFCQSGRQQHIRIPLIHGFNTGQPQEFAAYFSAYNTKNTVFEFLPYHEYGKDKWQTPYKMQNGFITPEVLQQFISVFQAYGLKIITT